MSFPYIFTFYSFKGGVGRSMAAANVAYALASRGRNVLLMDMDLEAPGLSTFFYKSKEVTEKSPLDALDLLGWADGWVKTHPGEYPDMDAIAKEGPNIGAFFLPVPRDKVPKPRLGEAGRLDLILVDTDRDYLQRFGDLKLPELPRDRIVRMSRVLWAYFKTRRFPREVPDYYGLAVPLEDPYDYVIVDSRTGYTEIGGLCVGPLADRLVVFTGLNVQNVEGTADFLKTVGVTKVREEGDKPHDEADAPPSDPNAPPRLGPKPTLLVASPVPIGETALKLGRMKTLQKRLQLPVGSSLTYHPLHAVRETLFVRDYPGEYLAMEYRTLADRVMAMVEDHPAQLAGASRKAWNKGQRADAIEAIVRLSPHEPNLGVPLLVQFADLIRPATQEEFRAADRMYRILASEHVDARWVALNNWGNMLTDWAKQTDGAGLKARRLAEAVARLDALLAADAAFTDQKAQALVNRGAAKAEAGDTQGELADYNAVLDMPDAPAEHKAAALVNRGMAKSDAGDTQGAIADCGAVLEMPDAPTEQKASASGNLGWARSLTGDLEGAVAASEQALALKPNMDWVQANLGLALLRLRRTDEGLRHYREAVGAIAQATRLDRLVVADLLDAMKAAGNLPGAEAVLEMVERRKGELAARQS